MAVADLSAAGGTTGRKIVEGRMIVCHDIHKHFGGFHAVDGVSLDIPAGAITGLIGPNGAGKTTLFNVIAGVHKPTSGTVTMAGEDVTGLPPHALFAKGLLRTFQIAQEFASMSVLENLMMVPGAQSGEALWNTWVNRRKIARGRGAVALQGARRARVSDSRTRARRKGREPVRRPKEASGARPHDDGGRAGSSFWTRSGPA